MEIPKNKIQLVPKCVGKIELLNLKKEFSNCRGYRERLKKMLEIRIEEIEGLSSEYLTKGFLEQKEKKEGPRVIRIKRTCLDFMSLLTGVKRKNLERGLTAFFFRYYNLVNLRMYSRDWMVFGHPECSDDKSKKVKKKTRKHPKTRSTNKSQPTRSSLTKIHQKPISGESVEIAQPKKQDLLPRTKIKAEPIFKGVTTRKRTRSINNDQLDTQKEKKTSKRLHLDSQNKMEPLIFNQTPIENETQQFYEPEIFDQNLFNTTFGFCAYIDEYDYLLPICSDFDLCPFLKQPYFH
ncbi:hypothetical protein M0813_28532 [Anaeramoeba flamelloides]|uniref:Uncharacterized protein n=1 Tax=Anaeramoeba flamelloides TaxID=1746091 RepID=A0ABQ8XUF2_9EUKA|nr:hypothetical protein M0813_28532 [Anaeramoeba flamelloides]